MEVAAWISEGLAIEEARVYGANEQKNAIDQFTLSPAM
jgi:hypothetical protein